MAELLVYAIEYIGASLYAYEAGAYLLAYSTAIAYTIIAVGTYAAIKSMQKIPNIGSLQSEAGGRLTMTRDTVASRRVIYGTARVSGPIVFASTNSSGTSNKNEFLHIIVALAGHEVSEFKAIFFNDIIAWDAENGQSYVFPSDKLAMTYKIGAPSQTAYEMTPATEWTSDCYLNGIASIYARLTADPAVYPNGIPNISAVVVGHKLQDENGNDVDYYDNPALILRHYLLNYFGATEDEIDETSFGIAKDACNYEPYGVGTGKRYTCNYTFTLNTKPSKVIEDILKTCYGKLIYTNGKFVMKAGVYSTPTITLNEDDIIGSINVTTKSSIANSFNSVRGLFVDGSNYTSSFQAADFVPVTSSFYLSEDSGVESQIDIELSGVTDHTVARRIAKLTLLDSRQDLTVSLTTKVSGLQLLAGDNLYLSVARYGWTNKVFEVNELGINADLSINLVLKETDSAIYDYPIGEDVDRDLSPNTNLPNPFIVSEPVGFSVIESTTIDKDGTIFPSATLNWSASYSGSISDIEIDFKQSASADYSAIGTFGRTVSEFTTIDVEAGKIYDFRARNFNYLGVYSPYVSQSILINGDNVPPQTPSSITATGATGSFSLTWTNAPIDTDYKFTKIWLNNTNTFGSATYQGSISGTTWNKAITSSGSYYAWLQNVDTSNNTSSISTSVNAFVSSIVADGSIGPSGSKGDTNYSIYKRSTLVPSTPTGNLTPVGWSITIPADDGNALWVSTGLISGADNVTLIGSWTTPQRLSGKASYYQTTAPQNGVDATLVIGDLWFDTDDAYKVYRWNGSSWVSVQDGNIAPLSSSLQQNITNTTNYSASLAYNITLNSSSFSTSLNQTNNTVTANSSSLAASITSVGAAVTTDSSSFAATITSLDSKVNTNSASLASSITTTNGVVTNNSSSFAISINNLTSTVNTNSSSFASSLTTTNNTVATNSSSAATSITTLSSTVNSNSSSLAASITTTATTVATLSGSVAGEYVLAVTAGNRVAGFKVLSSTTSSSFDVQADKFRIYNSTNGQTTQSFLADASGVYIDEAVIRSLNAGKITAGRIDVAVELTAAKLVSPQISGSGFMITSTNGMRYQNNNGNFIITGGSANGEGNGAQIDLVGVTGGAAGSKGVLALSAASGSAAQHPSATDGRIAFRVGGNEVFSLYKNGSLSDENAPIDAFIIFSGNNNRLGVNMLGTDSNLELGYFATGDRNSYIDFHSADSPADYSFRLLRQPGANGAMSFVQTGNGNISFNTDGSGTYTFDANVEATSFSIASSRRYKTNIIEFSNSIDIIKQITPKKFDYINGKMKNEIGFIAEELNEVLPNVVHKNQAGEPEGVDYARLTPVLLGAIKEQQAMIEDLQSRLSKLEAKNK
jgi:hypothetical protein